MATTTLPDTEIMESKSEATKPAGTKYVYSFGGGKADGNGKMKDVLGGKGAGLAEMTNAGLPVPPGFTIQTEACREYMRNGAVSKDVDRQMEEALAKLENAAGPETRQGRQSAAGQRALGREIFHARHDGHHSQPRPERPKRGSARQAQQQSALCLRFLSPPDSDVRQRRARHREIGI